METSFGREPLSPRLAPDALSPLGADTNLPPMTLLARGLALLAMVGGAAGLCLATTVQSHTFPSYLTQNTIAPGPRQSLLLGAGLGALLAMALTTAILLWKESRQSPGPGWLATRLDEVGRRIAPLGIAAFLPMLLDWKTWQDRHVDFLILVLVFSLLGSWCVRVALGAPPLFRRADDDAKARAQARALAVGRSRSERLALGLVLLGTAGYVVFFSLVTIRNHHNLHTSSFDLALEENIIWNTLHGFKFFHSSPLSGPTGTHFGHHATLFTYLLVPLYALYQHAETLLVIQAVMMGTAALPLFFFARRNIGSWGACAVAFTYLLYPPLHGAALYDFHYLPLGPVFLWSSLYFLETRQNKWAALFIILTLSVREDVAAGLGIVGAYLVLSGKRPKAGILVGAMGAVMFVTMKLIVMPRFAGHEAFVYMYAGLLPAGESSFGGVLKTVATNPGFTFASLIEYNKLIYVLQLLVPLALLPVRRPFGLLFVLVGFLFTLLSTGYAPLIQTSFQYTTHWTSFLFIGLVQTLAWLRRDALDHPNLRGRWIGALVALGCALVPSTYQYGAILQQNTVRGGFGQYDFNTSTEEWTQRQQLRELLARVPPKASIAGSETLVPQFSNRAEAYTLRTGNFSADYLLFTLPIRSDERPHVADPLAAGQYGIVAVSGPFALAKKGHPTTLNHTIAGRM